MLKAPLSAFCILWSFWDVSDLCVTLHSKVMSIFENIFHRRHVATGMPLSWGRSGEILLHYNTSFVKRLIAQPNSPFPALFRLSDVPALVRMRLTLLSTFIENSAEVLMWRQHQSRSTNVAFIAPTITRRRYFAVKNAQKCALRTFSNGAEFRYGYCLGNCRASCRVISIREQKTLFYLWVDRLLHSCKWTDYKLISEIQISWVGRLTRFCAKISCLETEGEHITLSKVIFGDRRPLTKANSGWFTEFSTF